MQDWDESWIDATYTIVRKEYDRSYNLMRSDLGPNDNDGDHDSDHDYIAVGSVSFLTFFFASAMTYSNTPWSVFR